MTNTTENKMKFFALYWGQKVMVNDSEIFEVGYLDDRDPDDYLELKPIASISDADLIEGFNLLKPHTFLDKFTSKTILNVVKREVLNMFTDITCKGIYSPYTLFQLISFLRSKGYYLENGEHIEYGWVKLKED